MTLRKHVMCWFDTWVEMRDATPEGEAELIQLYASYLKTGNYSDLTLWTWTYPELPNGTHGRPHKRRRLDLEQLATPATIGGAE